MVIYHLIFCGQGRHWRPVPLQLCQTKSYWCSFLTGFKSTCFFLFCIILFFCFLNFSFYFILRCPMFRFSTVGFMVLLSWTYFDAGRILMGYFLSLWILMRWWHFSYMNGWWRRVFLCFRYLIMKLLLMQLPDYFEVIEKPMDFGTVRKKLDRGAYKKLEELEVCSEFWSAMFQFAFFHLAPVTDSVVVLHQVHKLAFFENTWHLCSSSCYCDQLCYFIIFMLCGDWPLILNKECQQSCKVYFGHLEYFKLCFFFMLFVTCKA